MTDVVAAIQSAIDIVGKLRALSKKVEDADFKMLLADLSSELADAKLEVANLKVSLAELTEVNQELMEKFARKTNETPALSDGAYSFTGQDGLFCTACFDTKQQKVRVTPLTGAFRTFGKWRCPSCKENLGGGL
ncbi:hypothetical protein [Achromobacter sp. AGC39]